VKDWKFHCSVLGVPENALLKDVRKAYRRLALERHPDKHNGSQKAKEDFQQLNESYRHIAAGLIKGHKSEPAPSKNSPYSPRYSGTIQHSALPTPKRNFKKVWLHAGLACFAVLMISFFTERREIRQPASQSYDRDLFPKAWCFITHENNGEELQSVAELWSQRNCENKCNSMAELKDVSCEWSGDKFRRAKASPMPVAAPPITLATCEINIEGRNSISITPYQNQTEKTCQALCLETLKEKTRDGIVCAWNGREFKQQQKSINILAQEPPIATRPPPAPLAETSEFRSSCYMSVVTEDGTFADSFANDSKDTCEARCVSEINAHPTGREIKCAFAGKQLITYIPDPMVSYMTRDPAGSGIQQGIDFVAACQISGRIGQRKTLGRADANTEPQCKSACAAAFRKTPNGTEVVCSFNGEKFFQKKVSD